MDIQTSATQETPTTRQPQRRSGFWSWFIALIVIGAIGYSVYVILLKNPCGLPVQFAIGDVDSRFKITEADVQKTAEDAAARWNTQLGETVLNYNPSAKLKINLIYDERQAKIDKITTELGSLDVTGNSIESLRKKVQDLIVQYQKDITSYSAEVSSWNAQGGASGDTYNRLQTEKLSLEKRRDSINNSADFLNQQIDQQNSNIGQLNTEINSDKNKIITQGLYYPADVKIDIFTFGNKEELRLVEMHELGHSLSLDHDSEDTSLMFPILEKQDLTNPRLSDEDVRVFDKTCKSPAGALKELGKKLLRLGSNLTTGIN